MVRGGRASTISVSTVRPLSGPSVRMALTVGPDGSGMSGLLGR
jgi:hypothetical protein